MKCSEVKYYLNDFSRGLLLDEVRTEIHEHINSCNICAKALDEIITLRSKAGLKHRFATSGQKVRVKIHKNIGENNSSEKITSKVFPSVSTLSSEADHLKTNLLIKANEIDNNKLFTIAGIISIITLGVTLAFIIFDQSSPSFWTVERISGYPVIESKVLADEDVINFGEKLFTDSESRARLKVGTIGEIDIDPGSEVQIIETNSSEHKLILSKGKISARTWVTPKFFSIKTPSAVVKDLGCIYYLSVNEKSLTTLNVKSGWVLMENNNRKSLLPEETSCYSDITKGVGTPFSNNATNLFKESLYKLNFENGSAAELEIVLSESRKEDLVSMVHLLKSLDEESRGKIYDRIAILFKLPQRITREGIIKGDKNMMGRLWTELGAGSISMYQNL